MSNCKVVVPAFCLAFRWAFLGIGSFEYTNRVVWAKRLRICMKCPLYDRGVPALLQSKSDIRDGGRHYSTVRVWLLHAE